MLTLSSQAITPATLQCACLPGRVIALHNVLPIGAVGDGRLVVEVAVNHHVFHAGQRLS
jgi:hypothetical protein